MTEEYREIIDEFCEVAGDEDSFTLEVMKIEQLKRIADVLEDINGALISMSGDVEALGECVGYVPPQQGYVKTKGYKFLQIGGSVDTGV